MSTVKVHEFTQPEFVCPGEHILCAFVIGPDRDDPTKKTLHLRTKSDVLNIVRDASAEVRLRFVQDATKLLERLIEEVLR